MKNMLYEILDHITMIFSPLVEYLFDHGEALSACHEMRKNGGAYKKRPTRLLYETRVLSARDGQSHLAGEHAHE